MKPISARTLPLIAALTALSFGAAAASPGNASTPAADKAFARKAAMGGMAEVEMGKLAQEKASNAQVKEFAARMVTDHGKANEELKGVAGAKDITLPTSMGPEHKAAMDKLSKLSGDAFDREYMKDMVADHDKTVADFQKEAKGGKDADVKGFASKTLPTLQEHQKMAKATHAALGGAKGGKKK
jgi:putative membrane protein